LVLLKFYNLKFKQANILLYNILLYNILLYNLNTHKMFKMVYKRLHIKLNNMLTLSHLQKLHRATEWMAKIFAEACAEAKAEADAEAKAEADAEAKAEADAEPNAQENASPAIAISDSEESEHEPGEGLAGGEEDASDDELAHGEELVTAERKRKRKKCVRSRNMPVGWKTEQLQLGIPMRKVSEIWKSYGQEAQDKIIEKYKGMAMADGNGGAAGGAAAKPKRVKQVARLVPEESASSHSEDSD
jgi:hypothetical protein